MFRGFNLIDLDRNSVIFSDTGIRERYASRGTSIYETDRKTAKRSLDEFVGPGGMIDGSALQGHWFPQTKADVFISHSHNDLPLAQAVAGWIEIEFGLRPFIDSAIWGDSDELLRNIDNDYCPNDGGQTYSYSKRNRSTSIVHMMLAGALGKMIDNTECLMFLNTPQSLRLEDEVGRTRSPWIYAELCITDSVRRRPRECHRGQKTAFLQEKRAQAEQLNVEFVVPIGSLVPVGDHDLLNWKYSRRKEEHALDALYRTVSAESREMMIVTE